MRDPSSIRSTGVCSGGPPTGSLPMLRASPLAPLCLLAVIVASFVAPAAAQAADPVRTAPTTPRTLPAPVTGDGVPSAAGRWIVMLRGDASVTAAETRARGMGVVVDRAFSHVVRGYSAKLDGRQFATLRADPERRRARPRRRDPAPGPVHAPGRAPRVRRPRARSRRSTASTSEWTPTSRSSTPASRRTNPDLNVVGGVTAPRPTPTRGATGTGTGRTWPGSSARSTTASAWSAWRPACACGPSGS